MKRLTVVAVMIAGFSVGAVGQRGGFHGGFSGSSGGFSGSHMGFPGAHPGFPRRGFRFSRASGWGDSWGIWGMFGAAANSAVAASRHMALYGTTSRQLGEVE